MRVTPPCHPRHTASIIFCVVYHPPRAPTAQLLINHIIDTADALRVRYPAAKLVICGDFNRLNIDDILSQLHLTQVVGFPTHGQATLDLIITDLSQQYLSPQPLPPMGRSNHLSVLWNPAPTLSTPKATVTKTHRPMPDSAMREFGQWVVQHTWTEVTAVDDVHDKWRNYTRTTTEAFHRFFPVKSFPVHHSDAPWITPRIKRLISQRDRAFHTDTALYKRARNRVIREIKAAKTSFYPSKIHHLKQANNKQWHYKIKTLCGLNKHTSTLPCTSHLSSDRAAEEINAHFADISQSLPALDTSLLPAYLPSPSPPPTVQEADVVIKMKKIQTQQVHHAH